MKYKEFRGQLRSVVALMKTNPNPVLESYVSAIEGLLEKYDDPNIQKMLNPAGIIGPMIRAGFEPYEVAIFIVGQISMLHDVTGFTKTVAVKKAQEAKFGKPKIVKPH